MDAAAAHAGLVELMQARQGRGLDLGALLDFRHLSRLCALGCTFPTCGQRSMELEQRAGDLYAATGRKAPKDIAYLEWRIGKLLCDFDYCLARKAA
jgi:hypothetical protein